ncbi:MAG: WG repeat-containing protein [Clostridia bacterium]|nr:WG repeat-containing protein [Clostridia bacterium]
MKIICSILALLLCLSLFSCQAEEEPRKDLASDEIQSSNETDTEYSTDKIQPSDDTNTEHSAEEETSKPTAPSVPSLVEAEIYKEYNLTKIDSFHNGIAAFLIHKPSSTTHYSGYGSWNGDYYYGFCDLDGDILIDPIYPCNPYIDLPKFQSGYALVEGADKNDILIDKNGTVKFRVGESQITGLGSVSEGYFWVETVEELLSGNAYTVTYYSAKDLSKVAVIENVRAVTENRSYHTENGDANSTFNERGIAVLEKVKSSYNDKLLYVDIRDFDPSYVSEFHDWKLDLSEIPDFSSINKKYHTPSKNPNGSGLVSTVTLLNSSSVYFYSIIDENGNFLMEPQKNVEFPVSGDVTAQVKMSMSQYMFSHALCHARDAETGYWGYIDVTGEWKIQPKFYKATSFSEDGYAIINDKVVIDTNGNVVLAPSSYKHEVENISSLSGTYRLSTSSDIKYYLIFDEDKNITVKQSISGSYFTKKGTYELSGSKITFNNFSLSATLPLSNGVHTFQKEGNTIIIDGQSWILVETK